MHHQTCINESIPICLDRVHTKRPFAKCAGHYNLKTNKQSGHQDWCIHSYHDISVHTLLAITQHVEQQASCACSLLASKNDASVLVVVVDHRQRPSEMQLVFLVRVRTCLLEGCPIAMKLKPDLSEFRWRLYFFCFREFKLVGVGIIHC